MVGPDEATTIAAAYDLGELLAVSGPTARGEQGETYRLDTSSGSWAIKRPFARIREEQTEPGATFQQAVREAGVGAPIVARTTNGRVVLDLGPTAVRVFGWADLREPDPLLNPATVGRAVATIHRVGARLTPDATPHRDAGPADPAIDSWFTDPVPPSSWDELAGALAAAGAPFAADLAALRDDLIAINTLLEPPAAVQLCHRDLFADNLRATVDGELCVIDWEDCGPADPSQELGLLLVEFAAGAPGRARALYRAYLQAGGPGRVDHRGSFSMVIAQLSHITERAGRRWLAAGPDDPERARMADLFGQFASAPLTVAVIDELLEALRG